MPLSACSARLPASPINGHGKHDGSTVILTAFEMYRVKPRTPAALERQWEAFYLDNWAEVTGELNLRPGQGTLSAYINRGRWVADCPVCLAGIACTPAYPRGCCLECGLLYTIRFPPRRGDIEQLLLRRPVVNRNWWPHESLADLARENAERGV